MLNDILLWYEQALKSNESQKATFFLKSEINTRKINSNLIFYNRSNKINKNSIQSETNTIFFVYFQYFHILQKCTMRLKVHPDASRLPCDPKTNPIIQIQ